MLIISIVVLCILVFGIWMWYEFKHPMVDLGKSLEKEHDGEVKSKESSRLPNFQKNSIIDT